MTELLKFKLELQDMMSGMVKKIGTTTHSVFGGIGRDLDGAQKKLNMTGKSVSQLESHLKLLTQKRDLVIGTESINRANREISELQRHIDRLKGSGQGGGSIMGGGIGVGGVAGGAFLGNAIYYGLQRSAGMIQGQVQDVFAKGMSAEVAQMEFEAYAGKEKGQRLYKDLSKYIKETTFGPELYNEATTMLSYKLPADSLMETVKMLGDVSRGKMDKFHSLAYALSQTYSYGHLRGNEMLQYGDAGFNPSAVIGAKLFPKLGDTERTARMDKLIGEGKISAEMVLGALRSETGPGGMFYGMMNKIAETNYGKQAAIEGNIDQSKMEMGLKLMDSYSKFLKQMEPVVDKLPEALDKLLPHMQGMVKGLGDGVTWLSNNTDSIKKLITATEWLGGLYIATQAAGLVNNTAMALGGGALVPGAWSMAGKGAGLIEAMTGLSIGAVGGVGALISLAAYAAWSTWRSYEDNKERNAELAKGYMQRGQLGGVSGNAGHPGAGYLTREQMEPQRHTLSGLRSNSVSMDLKEGLPGAGGGKPVMNTDADTITSGGQRQFVINMNAPMYKVEKQVFERVSDMVADMEPKVLEALWRILRTVPA